MSCYLGIDIGTYEAKGALVGRDGELLASAARPHKMIVPQAGWAEHRAREDWWDGFTTLSRRLLSESRIDPAEISAVGCSAIGPCMLPVDGDGAPLMNAVLYGVDGRAAREVEELTAEIGLDRLLDRCGNALTSQSVGPKILWLKRNRPEVFDQARKILTSTSFLVHRLTGAYVIDHYTAANFSPLYVVDERRWSDDLSPDIIDLERLPEVKWSTEIAGEITSAAAQETGLKAGTPVITGTVDAASEAISIGVLNARDMMIMYGSTVFIIALTDQRVKDARLWYAPWLFEHQHALMSGLPTAGTLTHWFRDQVARDLDPATAFPDLTEEARQSPPGARGLVVLPYFSGLLTPINDPFAKGAIFGLNLTHSRGDLFRAALEGIANATGHIIEAYEDLGERPRRAIAVGGGTKNDVWLQATSDICGLTQILRRRSLGASYGDAFLAALGIGDVGPNVIEVWNPEAARVEPEDHAVYRRQYAAFRALYDRNKDLMADLGG